MNYKKFYEALENIKSGTCVRITYTSCVPIRSEFKDKCQDIKKNGVNNSSIRRPI